MIHDIIRVAEIACVAQNKKNIVHISCVVDWCEPADRQPIKFRQNHVRDDADEEKGTGYIVPHVSLNPKGNGQGGTARSPLLKPALLAHRGVLWPIWSVAPRS